MRVVERNEFGRKIVDDYESEPNRWDTGTVRGDFESFHFDGQPVPLDTSVLLNVTPFAVLWDNKEKLVDEIAAVIRKYQI